MELTYLEGLTTGVVSVDSPLVLLLALVRRFLEGLRETFLLG